VHEMEGFRSRHLVVVKLGGSLECGIAHSHLVKAIKECITPEFDHVNT
jgi:hypothetical protein